jgi:hypothetical protein
VDAYTSGAYSDLFRRGGDVSDLEGWAAPQPHLPSHHPLRSMGDADSATELDRALGAALPDLGAALLRTEANGQQPLLGDAEQVMARYLDLDGRVCVALPANRAHIEQAAHSRDRVVHMLWQVTDRLHQRAERHLPARGAGRRPDGRGRGAHAVSPFLTALSDWQRVVAPPAVLQDMVAAGLAVLKEAADVEAV